MSNITKGDNSKEGRVVILVRNMLSCPILQFYKVPSKYSEWYSSYRADEKSISNKTKGDNSKSKKILQRVFDLQSGHELDVVLALTFEFRKSWDFLLLTSESSGNQIFSLTSKHLTALFLNPHLRSKTAIFKLNNIKIPPNFFFFL